MLGKFAATAFVAITEVSILATATTALAKAKSREEWKKEYIRPTAILFPEENPYSAEKAELGRKLFFDPRLSGANYISCATCHNQSFSWGDGLPKGIGHAMTRLGHRTPTILNLAWSEQLMWDGRFETLEEQALGPMSAPVEKNQNMESIVSELKSIPEYGTLFNVSFPGEEVTVENIAKAIATFERTVVSGVAPFDRWVASDENAISDTAKHGFDLFNNKANCVACHSGRRYGGRNQTEPPAGRDRRDDQGDHLLQGQPEPSGRPAPGTKKSARRKTETGRGGSRVAQARSPRDGRLVREECPDGRRVFDRFDRTPE